MADNSIMSGLPAPTDGCSSCVAYRKEIHRLRLLVCTPLTMLRVALEDCEQGFLFSALDVIEEWKESLKDK